MRQKFQVATGYLNGPRDENNLVSIQFSKVKISGVYCLMEPQGTFST